MNHLEALSVLTVLAPFSAEHIEYFADHTSAILVGGLTAIATSPLAAAEARRLSGGALREAAEDAKEHAETCKGCVGALASPAKETP